MGHFQIAGFGGGLYFLICILVPAKENDPRAKWYIEEFGNVSWELDALKPQVLTKLLESEIKKLLDLELYDEIILEENREKEQLVQFVKGLN